MTLDSKQYQAFISYSHRDAKWAKWLHRSLERYVVPVDAFAEGEKLGSDGSEKRRRLTPIFRDRDELPAAGSLSDTIQQALESSENLIVLCSPNSAASQYVNAEIETFRGLHPDNEKKIYALIIEGEPPECFPPELISGGAEPIAADAREEGDGKADAKLKLIAGMLGVGFDRLKRREAKRQRNRLLAMVTVVSAVAVMTSALALWALKSEKEANKQRELAEQRQVEAEEAREATEQALSREEHAKQGEMVQRKAAEESATEANDARELAEERREQAEQSAKESKAVLEFYNKNVMATVRPEYSSGGLGIDATIAEAIGAAEPKIEKSFAKQPRIEASIREALGATFGYMGESSTRVTQLQRAVELRKKEQGFDHPDTLSALMGLARAYASARRAEEALVLCEEIVQLAKNKYGTEHLTTLVALELLATHCSRTGRVEKSLVLAEDNLRLSKKVRGPENWATIVSMEQLANAYGAVNRHEEALKLNEEALKLSKDLFGYQHGSTLDRMGNLARANDKMGRYEESMALHEEALSLGEKLFGSEHIKTMVSMKDVAYAYERDGRTEEALEMLKKWHELNKKIWGPEHRNTLNRSRELAIVYNRSGRHKEAIDLGGKALIVMKRVLGRRDYDTLQLMRDLASFYKKIDQKEDAEEIYRNYISLQQKEVSHDRFYFNVHRELGFMLSQQKKYTEAEMFLLIAQKGMEDTVKNSNPHDFKLCIENLVKLYQAWDKPDKTAEWQVKLDELKSGEK